MSNVEVSINVKIDGEDSFNFARRIVLDTKVEFEVPKVYDGNGSTFVAAIPVGPLTTIGALIVAPNKQMTIRLNSQSNAGIILNAGGLLLLIDSAINSVIGVNNNSGDAGELTGLVGGT